MTETNSDYRVITLPLSRGKVTVVDADIPNELLEKKWYYSHENGYAVHVTRDKPRKRETLHRLIIDAKPGEQVDHINHDKLDNRRINLRVCTNSQNHMNLPPRTGLWSRFKGVTWNQRERKWVAQIKLNGKSKGLGRFTDETEAARAYDKAAVELFGEFACINFPQESNNG